MMLEEITKYKKVTIQCHDNPDADAIASGFALYTYLKEAGIDVTLMYSGKMKIQKDNLKIMVEELDIPIEYREDHKEMIEGLLITVDCQYGAKNVTKFAAEDVMIIDHHNYEVEDIEKVYIVSNYGSCSTVVWQLLNEVDFDYSKYPTVQTALYYGLYSDTVQFVNAMDPVDRDMQDSLKYDTELFHRLLNSNISLRELEIAGVAMIRTVINKELHFAVVKAEPCDPNILGLISDFVLQVSEIDMCVVFNILPHGIKFSVRTCVKECRADHVANFISKEIGSGGGHTHKAGGFIGLTDYEKVYGDFDQITYFSNKLKEYLDAYRIVYTEKESYDCNGSKKYRKKRLHVGYVKASAILPVGKETTIRTLEGDLNVVITEDMYIMIGVQGEIYPISEANFKKNYTPIDTPYNMKLKYHPKAKIIDIGKEYSLLDYAKSCETKNQNIIYAKPLEQGVKVFTAWDPDCYLLGEPGDYFVAKEDDLHDIYIVEKNIFKITYDEIDG